MRKIQILLLLATLGIALCPSSMSAHHSMGVYDQTSVVTFKGAITRIEWRNPHTWVTITVSNPDGTTTLHRIEIAGPGGLIRKGFGQNLLNVGDVVAFEAWMPKDPKFGNQPAGRFLTLADGRRFDVGDNWP